jgi:NAD(P)-dependent dehydrogenase (short-subunit alcohol dehydrogenase family)
MRIEGAAALVTGGSRGLGEALARILAARGARVVVAAREREPLERVVGEIRAAGGRAHALAADVGRKEDILPLAGAAAALAGPIDLLVHNASTLGPVPLRPLSDTECEDFGRALEVNLVGPFRLTKAVAGSMMLRRRGLVVAVTSDAGVVPYEGWGAYGTSKAALDHLMRIWAAELAGTGVRTLVVDPGEMDTEMHAQAMPDADRSALRSPGEVAARLATLIEASDLVESGQRVDLMAWRPAPVAS